MEISKEAIPEELHKQLKDYVYDIIGQMHYVHKDLGPGLPEYIYQEALVKRIEKQIVKPLKEFQYHPIFDGEPLESYVKMDLVVPMNRGNIIIECKSISAITTKERLQTYGYLRATRFPIAILVNFGSWPKAEIERYYYNDGTIYAF